MPVVVVTVPAGEIDPWINVAEISEQVSDLAEVHLISTVEASWEFARGMPEGTQVFGGAGRVYPLGDRFVLHIDDAPLRMAFNAREGEFATKRLISDALSLAFVSSQAIALENISDKRVSGEIKGFVAGRVVVQLDGEGYAYIAPELTLAGFVAEELFVPKQRVVGELNVATKRMDVTSSLRNQHEALGAYGFGDIILVQVEDVQFESVTLVIYPQVRERALKVTVPKEMVTGNPLDDLRDLLAHGDVVVARVYGVDPHWAVVLTDIDEDEPVIAPPSVLPGGPPWLILQAFDSSDVASEVPTGLSSSIVGDQEPTEVEQIPRQGRKLTEQLLLAIESKKAESADLAERVHLFGAHLQQAENDRELLRVELDKTKREVSVLTAELARARANLRKVKLAKGEFRIKPLFADIEQGFRYLVLTQWALRVPVGEQNARPLLHYEIGGNFLDSLKNLQGISEEKVADVVFEIVTGLANELDSRDVHRLRIGASGASREVTRDDGAVCWRASLQVATSGARRIHYWVLPGGTIELSRVTIHDDFNP